MAATDPRHNDSYFIQLADQVPVDLITGTSYTISTVNYDNVVVIPTLMVVHFNNVKGTASVAPIAIIDRGTTGQNMSASTTFSSLAQDTYRLLATNATPLAITGDAGTQEMRLLITTPGVGQATTDRERTDNVATITTGAAHGLVAGDEIWVRSMTDTTYNGRVTVLSAPSATTFTYSNTGADEASTADTAGRIGAIEALVSVFGMYR